MNNKSLAFASAADTIIKDVTGRGRIIASAFSVAVARAVGLPTAAVTDAESYFNVQAMAQVRLLLSAANEDVVFDVPLAEGITRQLWMLRYLAAYPNSRSLRCRQYGFIDTVAGAGQCISDETHAMLNKYKEEILDLVMYAEEVISEVHCG